MDSTQDGLQLDYLTKYRQRFKSAGHKHPMIKLASALIKGLNKTNTERHFVVEGLWAHEKLAQPQLEVEVFLFCPEFIYSAQAKEIVGKFLQVAKEAYQVSEKIFLKLSERDSPDGLMSICKLPTATLDEIALDDHNLLVILDGLEKPGNIGSIIRSLDGAHGDGVIICNRRARIAHPKMIKGSMGASFSIPIIEVEVDQLISWLTRKQFRIFLTDTSAVKNYYQTDFSGRVAIVAGNERYGISKTWYESEHQKIAIPMLGNCDSLNVSVATSIIIYEASLQKRGLFRDVQI